MGFLLFYFIISLTYQMARTSPLPDIGILKRDISAVQSEFFERPHDTTSGLTDPVSASELPQTPVGSGLQSSVPVWSYVVLTLLVLTIVLNCYCLAVFRPLICACVGDALTYLFPHERADVGMKVTYSLTLSGSEIHSISADMLSERYPTSLLSDLTPQASLRPPLGVSPCVRTDGLTPSVTGSTSHVSSG